MGLAPGVKVDWFGNDNLNTRKTHVVNYLYLASCEMLGGVFGGSD
jgi:hypothetical protein